MMSKMLFLTGAVVLTFTSCKKNDEPSTNERVMGKWKIDNTKLNSVNGSSVAVTTYTGVAADYVEFRADNKVYSSVNGGLDTTNYTVANNQITLNKNTPGSVPQTYDIKTLTSAVLELYAKNVVSATEYAELFINLKK